MGYKFLRMIVLYWLFYKCLAMHDDYTTQIVAWKWDWIGAGE
jgi:hypothetical protein